MTDFTKQVGWSPSVPAPQASITVATDNGDGTGYITNPDGTVVNLCTECTVDTFATVSGSTVTDADGNSVTVPAGSTYNAATNSITTSDGQVVVLAVDTDTDTFATQNANGDLVLADGTVVPLAADTNTTSSLTVDAAARSYVHSGGDGNDTPLPIATTPTCEVLAPTGLVDDQYVSDFIDLGHHYSSANLANVTTPCNRSAVAVQDATLSSPATFAFAGSEIIISQTRAAAFGQVVTNNGGRSLAGGQNVTNNGSGSVVIGVELENAGLGSAVFGQGNVNTAVRSVISGAYNTTSGSLLQVSGSGHTITGALFTTVSGRDHVVGAMTRGLIAGASNTDNGSSSSFAMGDNLVLGAGCTCSTVLNKENEIAAGVAQANVRGRATINPTSNTTVWGYGGGLPALTSNRTVEIDHVTGNITTSGTLTTSAVFAGIGEKAIAAEKLPEGSLVVFEGLAGVREAKDGELPDGVTTKALIMAIGGGIDPDNAPWILDDMGNKLMEEVDVVTEVDVVDEEATEKAKEKAQKDYEKAVAKAETDEDITATVLEDVGTISKKKQLKSRVTQSVKNPKYDPTKLVETENVEMLGRQWALNPNGLKVGDHMTGGHIAGRGFRVLAVKDDMALLLIGCSVSE